MPVFVLTCRRICPYVGCVPVLRAGVPKDARGPQMKRMLKDIHNALDAQMSLPYSVSAALVHGEVGLRQFEADTRSDDLLRSLVQLTEIETAEDLDNDYPAKRPARVFITANGREFSEAVAQPYGEPDNPMSDDDLDAKFRRLVTPILGTQRTDAIAAASWALDDVATLLGLIGDPAHA